MLLMLSVIRAKIKFFCFLSYRGGSRVVCRGGAALDDAEVRWVMKAQIEPLEAVRLGREGGGWSKFIGFLSNIIRVVGPNSLILLTEPFCPCAQTIQIGIIVINRYLRDAK
jgi:hypothetical protein